MALVTVKWTLSPLRGNISAEKWTPRTICERVAKTQVVDRNGPEGCEIEELARMEKELVELCLEQMNRIGMETYPRYVAISSLWWTQWKLWAGVDSMQDDTVEVPKGKLKRPEKIVNALLVERGPNMNSMVQGIDYEWIPLDAWEVLKRFYDYDVEPVQRALNTRAARTGKKRSSKRRSSSIYDYYDMPETPKHWDISWPSIGPSETEDPYRCWVCAKPFSEKTCSWCKTARYCSKNCQTTHWPCHRNDCSVEKSLELGKHPVKPNLVERGLVGMKNLGNTCYMNATVQCLSHCWPLSKYFLSGAFKEDRNLESKLGTGGRFANSWAILMREFWLGSSSSITPMNMKREIGMLPGSAGQFAGFMQHDAQELLIFILDTLHEDLNLVKVKKYFPEGEDQVSSEKTVANLAAESWSKHMQREHSMISHLFQGQLHNSVVCPNCKFCSHTFSPFLSIPLSLPTEVNKTILVTVVRTEQTNSGALKLHRKRYALSAHPQSLFRAFKARMEELSDVPVKNQLLVELSDHYISRRLLKDDLVSSFREPNQLYVYEKYSPDLLRLPSALQERIDRAKERPQVDSEFGIVREIVLLHRVTLSSTENPSYKRTSLEGSPLVIPFRLSHSFLEIRLCILRILRLMTSGVDIFTDKKADMATLETEAKTLRLVFTDFKGRDRQLHPLDAQRIETKEEEEEEVSQFPTEDSMTVSEKPELFPPREYVFLAVDWTGIGPSDRSALAVTTIQKTNKGKKRKGGKPSNNNRDSSPSVQSLVKFFESAEFRAPDDNSVTIEVEKLKRLKEGNRKDCYSLHECLNFFSNMEQLSVGNLWKCPKCLLNQQAFKKLSIVRLPDVLIFSIKRFSGNRKLNAFVDFPLEGLDMAPYLAEFGGELEREDTVFDLYAVTNHYGSTSNFGHYTAHVAIPTKSRIGETPPSVTWFEFDDNRVSEINQYDVLSAAAYVLYYKRRHPHLEF